MSYRVIGVPGRESTNSGGGELSAPVSIRLEYRAIQSDPPKACNDGETSMALGKSSHLVYSLATTDRGLNSKRFFYSLRFIV
jgi:hypothetical protein